MEKLLAKLELLNLFNQNSPKILFIFGIANKYENISIASNY